MGTSSSPGLHIELAIWFLGWRCSLVFMLHSTQISLVNYQKPDYWWAALSFAGQKFVLSLPHRDVALLFYEVLSEFSSVASTNNSWFVTGKGSWGVELKLPLTVSVLFCSCLCYFHAGDSSSISPAPWHNAVPLTPLLFSEAMCLQFLLSFPSLKCAVGGASWIQKGQNSGGGDSLSQTMPC